MIVAFIINSSRKDSKTATATVSSAAVSQAKSWYENKYPVTGIANSKLVTQSTGGVSGALFDFSQFIQPDWTNAATYARLGKNVIDTPIAEGVNFGYDFNNKTANKIYSDKKYNRAYFLLLNDGTGYQAYVMMIMADSGYVKNDMSKLSHNSYRKHDPDFTGMVAYFTPNGQYVSGAAFVNGQIVTADATSQSASSQAVQSINTGTLKPITDVATTVTECTDWYADYYYDGKLAFTDFLGTTCTTTTTGDPNGTGSPGTGSGSPSAAPPPPPCQTSSAPVVESVGHLTVDVTEPAPTPPSDGGMPPPEPCPETTTPSTVVVDSTFKALICGGLTATETANLQSTVAAFETLNCASKFLSSYFSTQSFGFCIDSLSQNGNGGSVNYNPVNNSFTFTTDFAATPTFADLLEHEFFHLYQNSVYPGGTAKYAKSTAAGATNPAGFVNIEFEEAVFLDIATNSRQAFASGTGDQQTQYNGWINNLTNNGTIYPVLTPGTSAYTTFINQYNTYLSQYNDLPDNPNSSAAINLIPQAFLDIFQIVKPNC